MSSDILLNKFIKIAFALSCFFLFCQCAKQVRPSGGPEDKTAPKIIDVIPANNSTFVPLDQVVEFQFNEAMNRKSLEKAIFITPDPGKNIKYKWKGKRLILEFKEMLNKDRTYIFTLGTDLKDSHGNGLASSYTLAFSTGEKISDGKITGRVFSKQAKGILIWAFILNSNDEPNPSNSLPDYVTQVDNDGSYELSHLSKGSYRIFAIQDNDNNRFFEIGVDGIGVPQKDIELLSDSLTIDNINFKTQIQDTLGPAISGVSVDNTSNLTIRFDEEISQESARNLNNYSISLDNQSGVLDIVMAYQNAVDKTQVHLVTNKQTKDNEYIVKIDSLFDLHGNIIDPKFSYDYLTGTAQPDTFRPQITKITPEENAKTVKLDLPIELFFSEAMDTTSLPQNFMLLEDSTTAVPGAWVWSAANSGTFHPTELLKSAHKYLIKIPLDSIYDISGNSVAIDSTFMMGFRTLNIDTFSTISGNVIDEDSLAIGKIYLEAYQGEQKDNVYRIQLEQPGNYEFRDILPGVYIIEGFRDSDGNEVYSWGESYPFVPSERFFVYEDSLKIRARWPNEGNDIIIQK